MIKQNVDVKLEFHIDQEKCGDKIEIPTTNVQQNEFLPLLIFAPLFVFLFPILSEFFYNILLSNFKTLFFFVAGVSIYIYGRYAFEIHKINDVNIQLIKNNRWYLYNQYWFNGLGTFIGWFALYILLFYRLNISDSGVEFLSFVKDMDWRDFILMLVSYFGITGHFPYASLLQGWKTY